MPGPRFARSGTSAFVGIAVWLITFGLTGLSPTSASFPRVVTAFAALVLFPLLDDLVRRQSTRFVSPFYWRFPAAVLMTLGLFLPTGLWSTLLTLPWAVLLLGNAVIALRDMWRSRSAGRAWFDGWAGLALDAGLIYPAVGAVWLILASLGLRPLGFGDDIVILTAMHFHFAGAVLPILLASAVREAASSNAATPVVGVLAGIPLVAAGITVTQSGGPRAVEWLCAVWMATAGLFAARAMLLAAARSRNVLSGSLKLTASFSLAAGMLFAGAYGLRTLIHLEALTIPFMQGSHGLVMAFGFAACGTIGFWRESSTSPGSASGSKATTELELSRENPAQAHRLESPPRFSSTRANAP